MNPNGLLESSGDSHEPLHLVHIEYAVYVLVITQLLCAFHLAYEYYLKPKMVCILKCKAKKSTRRHFTVSYVCLAILVLNQTLNYKPKTKPTLFSFGVESLYTNRHLGSRFAILGYAYKLDSDSLEVCFHRVHQTTARLHPLFNNGIPNKHLIYTPRQALNFGGFAGQ